MCPELFSKDVSIPGGYFAYHVMKYAQPWIWNLDQSPVSKEAVTVPIEW